MSIADLYWIDLDFPGRLAVAPKPRGGDWLEDEVRSWKQAGVDCVACLLEDSEISELSLEREASNCAENGVAFIRFPIPDRGLPRSHSDAAILIASLVHHLRDGKNVLVHCRAGIGRTGLVAASCLVRLGVGADNALAAISRARRIEVPDTDAQRDWIFEFARNKNGEP